MNQKATKKLGIRDKRTVILAGILLLWIIILWKQSGPVGSNAHSNSASNSKTKASIRDPELLSWKLKQQVHPPPLEKRNIFIFYQSPPPPVPAEEQLAQMEIPEPVCGNQNCEEGEDYNNCPTDCQPPPPPPPPPITLRYIGYLSEVSGTVAFLTDGKTVFMGRVNDIVANKYRILRITEEDVELGYLNMDQRSTIRFQGNQGG